MNEEKLKTVVLTHGGAERFLELLAVIENVEIVGVFIEQKTEKSRSLGDKLRRSILYDGYLATLKKFAAIVFPAKIGSNSESKSADESRSDLVKCADRLGVPVILVDSYHSEESIELLRDAKADLGILYGTNIIKEAVFSIPRLGSINIHQGLAPIYRGGPTVFWELFNDEKELGITVHFVASAVDTGDIILQKTVPLEYDFSKYALDFGSFLDDFRASLKDPSAQLLAQATSEIADQKEKRIRQDTSIGKRYKLPVKTEKDRLLRILKERQRAKKHQ